MLVGHEGCLGHGGRAHHMDLPALRRNGVRAAAQRALHGSARRYSLRENFTADWRDDPPRLARWLIAAYVQIQPAAIPVEGLRVQRRTLLARSTTGQPVLWTQRRRQVLEAPPTLALRFDVLRHEST